MNVIDRAVAGLSYKDWTFYVAPIGTHRYLQVWFTAAGEDQHGRKWLLSEHMTEGEVVQTALMAVLAAEEHEAREHFHWEGEALFNPHLRIRVLHTIADEIEVRS